MLIDRAWLTIVTMDDAQRGVSTVHDDVNGTIKLTAADDKTNRWLLSRWRPDANTLVLAGTVEGESLAVRLRRVDAGGLRLNQGFHWTTDF